MAAAVRGKDGSLVMEILGELLRGLRRRSGLVAGLFLLLAAGAVAGAYLMDRSYEARAKLMIGYDARPVSVSRAELPSEAPGLLTVEAVTTLSELLSTSDVVEQLVDELGPEAFAGPPPSNPLVRAVAGLAEGISAGVRRALLAAGLVEEVPPRVALVQEVAGSLSVFPVRQSQVIEIAFAWHLPEVPPLVMRRLLEIYAERVAAFNAQAAQEGILSAEAAQAGERLRQAQAGLARLRAETGIVDPAARRAFLTERIQSLEPILAGDGAGPGVATAEAGVAGEVAELQRSLGALRIERAGALVELTEDSPSVRAIDARIAATEAELAAALGRVEAALARDRAELQHVLDQESAFAAALSEIAFATEAFRTYSQAADDRRVMRLGEEELRIRVIDQPPAVAAPAGPSRLVVVAAGLVFAFLAACLGALFVERIDQNRAAFPFAKLVLAPEPPAERPVSRRVGWRVRGRARRPVKARSPELPES